MLDFLIEQPVCWHPDLIFQGACGGRVFANSDFSLVLQSGRIANPLIVMRDPSWIGAWERAGSQVALRGLFETIPDEETQLLDNIARHVPWQWSDFSAAEYRRECAPVSCASQNPWADLIAASGCPWIWVWGEELVVPNEFLSVPVYQSSHPADFRARPQLKKKFWQQIQKEINPCLIP